MGLGNLFYKVGVESKVGQGSTFFFTLPKQKTEAAKDKDKELQVSFAS